MTKLLTIYFDGGVFSQIFDDTLAAKQLIGPKTF